MFEIAIGLGIYGYSIFVLGLFHLLYRPVVILFTLAFLYGCWFFGKKKKWAISFRPSLPKEKEKRIFFISLLIVIGIQALVNFIGVLGPELSFDALWYHLTLPKLYLEKHTILLPVSGILYYAPMPKFIELLYVGALSFGNEILAKLIHFGFGIFSLIVLYKIARKFVSPTLSLLALAIFYANPVSSWESTIAYIDLGRTCFELLTFLAFLNFWETKSKKWLIISSICMGFALTTKILALGSLGIFIILFFYQGYIHNFTLKKISSMVLKFVGISLLFPLPWMIVAFIFTRNPLYPFFSHAYPVTFSLQLLNPIFIVESFWRLFTHADDPIGPLYLGVLPFVFLLYKKFDKSFRVLFLYTLLSLVTWYCIPQTGGGRFILPYLPVFSLVVTCVFLLKTPTWFRYVLMLSIGIYMIIGIIYRAEANIKFVPVLLGRESKSLFLTKHLNFSFGDFYDTDGFFSKNIKPTDSVLLYGFHNMYYVNYPFIEASSVKRGDIFNYIATQNTQLPQRFRFWNLLYINSLTKVRVYSAGGIKWVY